MIKDDSILALLQKYSPRPDHSPRENFLTESFVWLLRNDTQAETTFFDLLKRKGIHQEKFTFLTPTAVNWTTQDYFPGIGFTDICIRPKSGNSLINDEKIIIEVKLDSGLSQDQIPKYRKISKTKAVLLIVRSESQIAQDPDAAILWSEIYASFRKLPDASWKLNEFLSLLEALELTPDPLPTLIDCKSYSVLIDLATSLEAERRKQQLLFQNLFKELLKDPDILNPFNDLTITCKDTYKDGFPDTQWGRNGIRWEKANGDTPNTCWTPAIYIGLIEDGGWDLWYSKSVFSSVPFCLIISVTTDLLDKEIKEKRDASLDEFITILRDKISKTEWILIGDNERSSPNPWHPVVLYQPIEKLIPASCTEEKLIDRFKNTVELLLSWAREAMSESKLAENLENLLRERQKQ